jgi:protein-S-isoprenylcysteine O-methyltransferase Ste14
MRRRVEALFAQDTATERRGYSTPTALRSIPAKAMDWLRYGLALLTICTLPPAVLFWYAIHPFVDFWRKFGPVWTYVILGGLSIALMGALFALGDHLVGADFGTSYPLIVVGVVCVAAAIWIALKRKKLLTWRILVGVPELTGRGERGRLLTEGIYARIRNPRYLEVILGTLGYVLIANHLGTYILFALLLPAIYGIVIMEERELRERFGTEYEEYCRRVPRLIPRRRAAVE